jgi:hypothetical protein
MTKQRLIAALLFVTSVAMAGTAPKFEDYPAAGPFHGPAAPPDLSGKKVRMFRSVLRDQAARGPNFAGHYTVAQWGCGAGCISWAIVDAQSGKVWLAPFIVSAPCGDDSDDCVPAINFRPDSELLVVTGARDEQGAGRYFYRWHDARLTLIHAIERQP